MRTAALALAERAIRAATGSAFKLVTAEPVAGGDTHETISVGDGGLRYFVKLGASESLPMFEAEADGLNALRACGAFRVPEVLALDADAKVSLLVLEHVAFGPLRSDDDGARFAEALAALHGMVGPEFGWHRDNYLGALPQSNTPSPNWAKFILHQRLHPQLARARDNGFAPLAKSVAKVIERIPALFLDYRPTPSLLHGDLWHGNAGITADGVPVLFDPAVHRGDRESELAMCELFGGFPTRFHARYRELLPLHHDYEQRKLVYALYYILNHLNLFGRGYLGEAERLARKLERVLT